MAESFTFSSGNRKPSSDKRCYGCERLIREYETGYIATGLCEDCQFEAEKQAELDNAACEPGYWDDPNGGGKVSF